MAPEATKAAEQFDFYKIFTFAGTREELATFGTIVSLIAILTGVGYKLGNDNGTADSKIYDSVKKLELETLSKEASSAAAELKKASSDFHELVDATKKLAVLTDAAAKLKDENQKLQNEKSDLQKANTEQGNNYKLLSQKYAALLDPKATEKVDLNKSISLLGGQLVIALVSSGPPKATFNINSQQRPTTTGDIINIVIPGPPKMDCRITVMEVNSFDAKIASQCAPQPAPVVAPPPPPPPRLP
jgi:hypothetical protein